MYGPKKLFLAIVGPTAVMAAGTMGAGSTSSLILAGTWFRYDLLWLAVLILPLFVVSIESASRIGLVNKTEGMFSLIRGRIHPSVAWLILAVNVPVHLFIAMAHMSIMTSASLSLIGIHPPGANPDTVGFPPYKLLEFVTSVMFAVGIIWLITSKGYQRMQRIMAAFMLLMFLCFLIVALRGFQEISAILSGFIPHIPADVEVPRLGIVRESSISSIAIIGSVLAPAAMLGIPYMSADNQVGEPNFRGEFYRSVLNLGLIYGGYSICVIIAGGFALFPLANHAEIDSVHEASRVLVRAFPEGFGFLGPIMFSVGMVMAALTTFVVVAEVISYFVLDMFGKNWHYTADNLLFKRMVMICIVTPAVLAPFWEVPALFKNLLLMAVNAVVIPLVYFALILLVNNKQVMQSHTAGISRNLLLGFGLLMSLGLAVFKLPDFIRQVF